MTDETFQSKKQQQKRETKVASFNSNIGINPENDRGNSSKLGEEMIFDIELYTKRDS